MAKKNILRGIVIAMLSVCMCLLFAACGDKSAKYSVTWTYDSSQISVSTQVKEVKQGDTLTFKVEGKNGYEVDKVQYRINGKLRNAKKTDDGSYSIVVSGDVEIVVTAVKGIESVTVTTNPTKMKYYTGEELDLTGMVVTVKYKTGDNDTETVTNYTVVYAQEDATSFSRGDTSFKVKFNDVESSAVTIDEVETKVSLNLRGGQLSSAAIAALQENSNIHDFTTSHDDVYDNDIYTFSFADIKAEDAIELPIAEAITFSENGNDWTFKYWQGEELGLGEDKTGIAKISNDTITTSDELSAIYDVSVVDIEKVYLTQEGDSKVPTLNIDVEYKSTGSAYLYLYEGNVAARFQGDEIEGNVGDKKTVKLALTEFANATYMEGADEEAGDPGVEKNFEGKWMDVKMRTTIHGMNYTVNAVVDPEKDIAEVGSSISDANNRYRLHYFYRNGKVEIKVLYKQYKYTYTVNVEKIGEDWTLVIDGDLNTALLEEGTNIEGGRVELNWADELEGTINADGSWKVTAKIADLAKIFNEAPGTQTAGTIAFYDADDNELDCFEIMGDNGSSGKFDLTGCLTVFDYGDATYGNPKYYFNTTNCDDTYQVTIGSDWNEPFLNIVELNSMITFENAELKVIDDTPCLIVNLTLGTDYTTANVAALLFENIYFDMQTYTGWAYYISGKEDLVEKASVYDASELDSEHKLAIKIDISGLTKSCGYYMHVGDKNSNWNPADYVPGASIVVDGTRYRFGYGPGNDDWETSLMTLWCENAVDPEYTVTTVKTELHEGKPCLVLNGTWNTETCDAAIATSEIANIARSQFERYSDWKKHEVALTGTATADGKFVIYVDMSALETTDSAQAWYYHFASDSLNGDQLKSSKGVSVEGTISTVTADGKTYTVTIPGDQSPVNWLQEVVVILVSEAAA